MTLNFFNSITIVCGIIMVWSAGSLYLLTRARSILVIVTALVYITIVRAAIAVSQTYPEHSVGSWVSENSSYFIFLFWPLMAIGFVMLLNSLKSTMVSDRRKKQIPFKGKDRRR